MIDWRMRNRPRATDEWYVHLAQVFVLKLIFLLMFLGYNLLFVEVWGRDP